jgi:hypothetical protein
MVAHRWGSVDPCECGGMRSVPGAVATGSQFTNGRVWLPNNPVAIARGTDLVIVLATDYATTPRLLSLTFRARAHYNPRDFKRGLETESG